MGKPCGSKKMVKVNPIWHPTSNYICVKWKNLVKIYSVTENDINHICSIPHDNTVWDISLSPNGKYLAVGTKNNMTIWDWYKETKVADDLGCSNPG